MEKIKMNGIKVFHNSEFGNIRVIKKENESWFIGKDVARVLGYSNIRDALSKHVEEEDKGVARCDTLGGMQSMVIINESGLYSLILSSKLPSAKRFKHWVTAEVLPVIRKTGGYLGDTKGLSDMEILSRAVLISQKTIEAQNNQLEQQAPKVLFADSVSASHTAILIGELAKLLYQNGINIGQNRLFSWMRENGYLINRQGTDYNMPTQRAMELKLFIIKETVINHSDGHTSVSRTSKVTGKGQVYFINKFLNGKEIQDAL